MNVNLLGEAILGEREAERRFAANLQNLQMPEIEVMSVKISTMYSQISALARDHTIQVLCDRVEMLYRSAVVSATFGQMARACQSSSPSTWKSIATWTSPPRYSCAPWIDPAWRQ